MAVKKSDLYSSLWQSCDELRGGMDASQYKDYVLVLLFVKYVSDKFAGQKYATIKVPEGGSFGDMTALKGKKEIGDGMNIIISKLAEANDLKGIIDVADFNDDAKLGSGKEMQDRLTNLIGIFENPALDFGNNRADDDDLLGDAYEYLMRHFATQSGKSKGQFYTPSEVSRIMAQIIGMTEADKSDQSILDPTCGSGSLLLKAASLAPAGIAIYGQEKDVATAGLAKMNMILHGHATAVVWRGNTMAAPQSTGENGGLAQYDYVVANPPFSDKAWMNGFTPANDEFDRFNHGVPPAKNGDYAYLLHVLKSLKSTGTACIVMPHGVLFRGNVESTIRKKLIDRGYIKGIIGLPANLFYGTGIPACLIVLDKETADKRANDKTGGIFMIDASKGYIKDGNKNRLREQDIHRIVDTFNRLGEKGQTDQRYARIVPVSEIKDPKNDYNLNLPRYIDSSEPEDIQDIDAHLNGGIPNRDIDALSAYWDVIPGVRKSLIKRAGRPGYCQLRVGVAEVKQTIYDHDEFADFIKSTTRLFTKWKKANHPRLSGFDTGGNPKQLIETIAEDLLATFAKAPLLDSYDVYQHLMDYWAESMQDDCYLIAADGWVARPQRIIEIIKTGKKKGDKKDKGWTCDLVPKPYIVARYFAKEQQAIDAREDELAKVAAEMEELKEEHGGEEGIMKDVSSKADAQEAYTEAIVSIWNEEDAQSCSNYNTLVESSEAAETKLKELSDHQHLAERKNAKGQVTLKSVKDRVKKMEANGDMNGQSPAGSEAAILTQYIETDKREKDDAKQAKKMLRDAESAIVARLNSSRLGASPGSSVPSSGNETVASAKTANLSEGYADLQAVVRYLDLLGQQSDLKGEIKTATEALDQLAHDKYPELSVDEIKSLVVDDKWMAMVATSIKGELNYVSQDLTKRIRELALRYENPLPELANQLESLSDKVMSHLGEMEVVCN